MPVAMQEPKQQRETGPLLVAAAAFCWGVSGGIAALLLSHGWHAGVLTLYRGGIGLACALLWLLLRPQLSGLDDRRLWCWGILAGLGVTGNFAFYFLSIAHGSVAVAATLMYCAPVYVYLGAVLAGVETSSPWKWAAIGLVLAGIVLLTGIWETDAMTLTALGVAAGLLSGLCYAVFIFAFRYAGRYGSPQAVLVVAFATLLPAVAWYADRGQASRALFTGDATLFLALGLLGAGLSFYIYVSGVRRTAPTVAAIVAMIEPITACLFAVLLLGERLAPLQIAGMGLILLAVTTLGANAGNRSSARAGQRMSAAGRRRRLFAITTQSSTVVHEPIAGADHRAGGASIFIEKIKSEGLSHLSYLIGSDGEAAVIDPRRDCEVYSDLAAERGCRITRIFETHRNEDLLSGAAVLALRTGASVHHGPDAAGDVNYARTAREGDSFSVGRITLRVLQTPGHTDDSVSYVLHDSDAGEDAVAVFTGDALFVGDVGRTDFYPERAREVAGLLFDSLRKLEALGDQAVIFPAHGAGSVCGAGMADRELSTIGVERRNNARFAMRDREAFIDAKVAERHEQPPYFRHMEAGNLSGASAISPGTGPAPLSAGAFGTLGNSTQLVDVRGAAAFLGAHLPGSLALPVDMIAAFAGWLLDPERPIALVAEDHGQAQRATRHLARIGYDHVTGYLSPSLVSWAAAGGAFASLPVVDAATVKARVEDPRDWTLLDVRSEDELAQERIPGSRHIYLGALPGELGSLDRGRSYTAMCGSGARASIAASILLRAGFERVDLFLGSMGAWQHTGYAVDAAA